MQPSDFTSTSALLIGQLAGLALPSAIILFLFFLNKRRRNARNERPPQNQKLLRPAGYSALQRLADLGDKFSFTLLLAVGAGLVFGMMAGPLYPLFRGLILRHFTLAQVWNTPKSGILVPITTFTLAALVCCIWQAIKVWKLERQMRNWRFGLRGEQAVAEKLADPALAAAGYVVFHDVPGDAKWNIDHVIVGPGGVFVLETKARARRKPTRDQKDSEVFFDGQTLQFPWCDDHKAARQVEANARWVREFIAAFPPKGVPVEPVILVPGWYVTPRGKYPIKVMNATYLVGYLKGMKPIFTRAQLDPVIARLDERCRTLEF